MKFTINTCDGIYKDSLDVRFTKACDNNCSFCIEKEGVGSLAKESNVPEMIRKTIESGKKTVLILGGEPFVYPESLLKYVKGIRYHVEQIFITTSLPNIFNFSEGQMSETLTDILALIDGLNVSLQHSDPKRNNEILRASNRYNRLEAVRKVLSSPYGDKARISINLVKGAIDTKEKVLEFLDILHSYGAKQVKINELQHSNLYVSFEDLFGIQLRSPFAHGCQTEINDQLADQRNYPGMKVILKRSCFAVQEDRKASLSDLCKVIARSAMRVRRNTLVLYEDGSLSDGWKLAR